MARQKSAPLQSGSAGGIDRDELNSVVVEEMAQLKLFLKEVQGTRNNDPDSQLKTFFRDKYRKKYLGEDGLAQTQASQNQITAGTPGGTPSKNGPRSPVRTKAQGPGTLARREVDYAVANSDCVEAQVGNTGAGWTAEIPDGWDCGYTYRYDKDSCPPMARGVPLPATFGGCGGGGKYTQILHEQSRKDPVSKITGRDPAQNTSEWVTWATHKDTIPSMRRTVYGGGNEDVGNERAPLALVSPGGRVVAVGTDTFGGSGKRGRNMAIDEFMSQRGGETNFSAIRGGRLESNDRRNEHPERVQNWYSPSRHNSNAWDPKAVQEDPRSFHKSEYGITNLGGGKKGRNQAKESALSEQWNSPQAKSNKGTDTGGGRRFKF
jgi:hypothetical protein